MTQDELKKILEAHKEWLIDNSKGSWANLSRADLSGANLSWADLSGANLSGANLSWADLSRADLSRANLSWADLSRADLSRANLSGANLSGANLSRADLSGANLSWANLSRANLSGANLSRADLSGANLSWANLSGANLSREDVNSLQETIEGRLILARFSILPAEGAFTGYKKVLGAEDRDIILTLEIQPDALRLNALSSRKCRASSAKVLKAETLDGSPAVGPFRSKHDREFVYNVGETATVGDFDISITEECSRGIHFFIRKEEAVAF